MDIHMDMDMGHGEAEMCRRRQTHKDEHAATERGALAAAQQPPRPHCVGEPENMRAAAAAAIARVLAGGRSLTLRPDSDT